MCLDGCCGTQVEMVDASLGIMGFVGTVRIMENVGASLNGSVGLPGRRGDGGKVQAGVDRPWHASRDEARLK